MRARPRYPLIAEDGMSDPHMLVEGDACYLFAGHDVGAGVSDWIMGDWRIYRSTDLLSWDLVGAIRPEDTYMGAGSADCWAGDIASRNGAGDSTQATRTAISSSGRATGPRVVQVPRPYYRPRARLLHRAGHIRRRRLDARRLFGARRKIQRLRQRAK
jgi:hypothetical protein